MTKAPEFVTTFHQDVPDMGIAYRQPHHVMYLGPDELYTEATTLGHFPVDDARAPQAHGAFTQETPVRWHTQWGTSDRPSGTPHRPWPHDWYPFSTPIVYSDRRSEDPSSYSDPHRQFVADYLQRNIEVWELRRIYQRRIEMLRSDAKDEGVELTADSERDFWEFVMLTNYRRRAGLALMNNGNIRAVWKDGGTSHLGLHFRGNREVSYVIFKRRDHGSRISRVSGLDTFEGIRIQVVAFGLRGLVEG